VPVQKFTSVVVVVYVYAFSYGVWPSWPLPAWQRLKVR